MVYVNKDDAKAIYIYIFFFYMGQRNIAAVIKENIRFLNVYLKRKIFGYKLYSTMLFLGERDFCHEKS